MRRCANGSRTISEELPGPETEDCGARASSLTNEARDYEDTYTGDVVSWCKAWLERVEQQLKCKPLIYLNQALIKKYDWKPVADSGYGLWVAAYTYDPTKNTFITGAWSFAAMQQWTNEQTVPGIAGKVDGDVFFGDATSFKKYGYLPPPPPPPADEKYYVTYKGETIATYETNPVDKIDELTLKLANCQDKCSQQAKEIAELTLALHHQETDNADLQQQLRDCQHEKDTALAEQKRLEVELKNATESLAMCQVDLKVCRDQDLKKCICQYSRGQLLRWGLFGKPSICKE